jgi:hypothetical protein
MNMLNCSKDNMELFWELGTSDLPSIMKSLNELNPKKVFKAGLEIDLIEKCLWILCKKFNFATTTKVKVDCFRQWKEAFSHGTLRIKISNVDIVF